MILTLLSHQWRSFWRGRSSGKNLVAQIFIGILLLYMLTVALVLGMSLRHFLATIFPGQDVLKVFCGLILYYFAFDILMRFMFQELPVLSVQPYLVQNIRRSQLVNFLNTRSLFHFLNLLPLLIFSPFTFTTIVAAHGWVAALCIMIAILGVAAFNHFLILYVKRKSIINSWWLVGFLVVVSAFIALDYFHIFSFRNLSALVFIKLLAAPWLAGIAVLLGVASFVNNKQFLVSNLYLEEMAKGSKQRQSTEYTWLQQLGLTGELIGLDIKLILRNKRPKSLTLFSSIILLYGFIFYKPVYLHPLSGMLLLGALMVTGIFIINYGQFLFAWQSSHFDGLMSSNVTMNAYIRSKLMLFIAVSTACFVLTSFYGLIDWRIIPIQAAAYLYNIGLNSVLAVYFATYSYKGIDLTKSATFNYQGLGTTQWLYGFAILLIPFLIYLPLALLVNPWAGIITIGAIGLISLLLQNWWIGILANEFSKRKHRILEGFRER